MQVTLYIFDKKINSTKLPQPGTASSLHQVVLKDGCTMLNPVLVFTGVENPTAYNYAYIPDFGKYYYVTNWEAYRDRWIVSLSVDVLASYRNQIGDSVQYVGRSESAYNTDIADNYYPAIGGYHMITKTLASIDDDGGSLVNPWTSSIAHGSYILQISGASSETGVTYYVCNYNGFIDFLQSLYSDNVLDNLFKQGVVQPFDYINSCKWFPLQLAGSGDNLSKIQFGSWKLDLNLRAGMGSSFKRISQSAYSSLRYKISASNIPVHPQAQIRGRFVKLSPYSNYTIHFAPFGIIKLEASSIYGATAIIVNVVIDQMTGIGTIYVLAQNESGENTLINTAQNNIAVDIPISGSSINIGNLIGGIANAGKSVNNAAAMVAATGGLAGASAVVSAAAAIGNSALAAVPIYETITTAAGSLSAYYFEPSLSLQYINISPENADAGRPLMDMRKINTLTGFVQIIDPHFEIAMTDTEMNALISAANSGFFFE